MLRAADLAHDVLTAHHEAREADISAQAAERRRIIVATNRAGRGTDFRLGPGVHELGGLHVVITEMHEVARIDRQLVGRRAQRKVEQRRFRRRKQLLAYKKHRNQSAMPLGLDPHLDLPG